MQREPGAFLWDVKEAAGHIHQFVLGLDFDSYIKNILVQSGVERQFEIIGEALNQLSKAAPAVAAKIPNLGQVVAFRNILIHGYVVLEDEIVWKVIQQDLPNLEKVVQQLLKENPPPAG